ncbi:tetratricopeptide repeat protein [Streptomyces lancefieldiae]|uniref:Tetratricopeptide repeat protein n=1 Tax=Streptomyces lancefieldiae TaxID=3075520 RepID=A0ABU3AZG2_9ACTN|nr:tetratricopeptide repeat protein [Streptomyces sp. DSM 40712]MDT0615240.1 tetratricopeptide repeat protein [Streptomyces sp. DSM 40712]
MTTDDIPDYYAEFGIDASATAEQISGQLDRAFRTWSSRASRAPDAKKRREAEDKVDLISEARKELLDRTRRHAYDRMLSQARQRSRSAKSAPRQQPQPQPGPHVRDWVGHARRLMSEGDDEGALYELRQAVHHDENNGDAWRLLGSIHANQGQLSDALQEFRRALALYPRDALTHVLIARVYEWLGRPVTAADWYLAAVRLAPDDIDYRIAAAQNLHEAGRYDEALSNYERALVERPGDAVICNQIGRIWTLRAEESMSWHPDRQRYVVASETGASNVTHCVDQALAVGVSDNELRDLLNTYREDASRARAKTWRWYRSMAGVMAGCFALMFVVPSVFKPLALAALVGLPIAMGIKPRWRHTLNDLPPNQKPQTGRAS